MINYDTTPAGPAMDRLIAEKVMGLEIAGEECAALRFVRMGNTVHPRNVPRYSTDIAHAWEVVERMRSLGCLMFIGPHPDNGPGWAVQSKQHTMNAHNLTMAETATLAICRAALLECEPF